MWRTPRRGRGSQPCRPALGMSEQRKVEGARLRRPRRARCETMDALDVQWLRQLEAENGEEAAGGAGPRSGGDERDLKKDGRRRPCAVLHVARSALNQSSKAAAERRSASPCERSRRSTRGTHPKPEWLQRRKEIPAKSADARLVSAADKLDNARAILMDLRRKAPASGTASTAASIGLVLPRVGARFREAGVGLLSTSSTWFVTDIERLAGRTQAA